MSILREVLNELRGMFFADARLAMGIAALVTGVVVLGGIFRIEPLAAGGVLLFGCVAILIEAVVHKAKSESSR